MLCQAAFTAIPSRRRPAGHGLDTLLWSIPASFHSQSPVNGVEGISNFLLLPTTLFRCPRAWHPRTQPSVRKVSDTGEPKDHRILKLERGCDCYPPAWRQSPLLPAGQRTLASPHPCHRGAPSNFLILLTGR